MSSLSDLVFLKTPELNALAKKQRLSGYGSMSKAEKIIALCTHPLSPQDQDVIQMNSKELYALAKAEGIENPSTLSQAELILALIQYESSNQDSPAAIITGDSDAVEFEKARALAKIKADREQTPVGIYQNTDPDRPSDLFFLQTMRYESAPPRTKLIEEVYP